MNRLLQIIKSDNCISCLSCLRFPALEIKAPMLSYYEIGASQSVSSRRGKWRGGEGHGGERGWGAQICPCSEFKYIKLKSCLIFILNGLVFIGHSEREKI